MGANCALIAQFGDPSYRGGGTNRGLKSISDFAVRTEKRAPGNSD